MIRKIDNTKLMLREHFDMLTNNREVLGMTEHSNLLTCCSSYLPSRSCTCACVRTVLTLFTQLLKEPFSGRYTHASITFNLYVILFKCSVRFVYVHHNMMTSNQYYQDIRIKF